MNLKVSDDFDKETGDLEDNACELDSRNESRVADSLPSTEAQAHDVLPKRDSSILLGLPSP